MGLNIEARAERAATRYALETRGFVRNSRIGAAMVARFPFVAMKVGEAFFVPDRRSPNGKRMPVPVKAANKELAPAVFRVREEVNAEGVPGRYVYRVA
jgi:hypothetical protein